MRERDVKTESEFLYSIFLECCCFFATVSRNLNKGMKIFKDRLASGSVVNPEKKKTVPVGQ